VKPSGKGDRGVVEVRTQLTNEHGVVVCRFDRKALVRAGAVSGRPAYGRPPVELAEEDARLPRELRDGVRQPLPPGGFAGFFEDFEVGDVVVHGVGKTVGESEHMQLTQLCRNSHPIHFDEVYCRENSFAKTRVVYGGLVLSWVLALTSRDLGGNALWDAGLDEGAHPSGVLAGDTLYASSKVLEKQDAGPSAGIVTLRVIGTKNRSGKELVSEPGFFSPELGKNEGKIPDKVVEITRKLLVRKAHG
jgi:2-methylfumaryl-CoA hydratase